MPKLLSELDIVLLGRLKISFVFYFRNQPCLVQRDLFTIQSTMKADKNSAFTEKIFSNDTRRIVCHVKINT